MRSEFEKLLKQHKDALTDELVKLGKHRQVQLVEWDIERNETDYEFYFDGAWNAQQSKIDELTLQVAEMKSRLNDAYTDWQSVMYTARQSKIDKLQKRLDAVKGLAQTLWEKSEEKHQQGKVWESKTLGECAEEILDVLEQVIKGVE